MSAEKVARLIADFDRPEPAKQRSRVVPFDHLHHSAVRPQQQPLVEKQPRASQPQPLVEKKPAVVEDDGYDRGLADGYANAKLEFEQKLEQERQALATQAAEERQHLLNETAAKIAADVTEAGQELQNKIAGVTARILEPIITSAAQKQAVASFVDHLSSIATDVRRPVLRLTGPSELLELIRSKLGVRAIAIEMRAGPEVEASITIDQVVLETQLKVWMDRLKLAIQG
jgi:hypothetical protein